MQLKYKRLGDYIKQSHEKNDNNDIKLLQGISNRKYFQKAKTNTIGIDLSKYRVVRIGEFAFNRATTRNGDKISIAYRQGEDCIVSPSYRIFSSKDENILNSEYLMIWFKRPEFDRYARFKSHGSAHEFFDWDEMCDVELPVPSIDKQKEIVKEYKTITDRIALNEQINQKLEETAQAIYKSWFIDFEFPNSEGKLYKSNAGEMIYCDELDVEIPKRWKSFKFEEITENIISHRGKSKDHLDFSIKDKEYKNPIISAMNVNNGKLVKHEKIKYVKDMTLFNWMKEPLVYDDVILTSEAPLGEMLLINKRKNYLLSQRLFGIRTDKKKCSGAFLYFWLQTPIAKRDLESRASGTTVMGIKLSELKKIKVLIPEMKVMESFTDKVFRILNLKESKEIEIEKLNEFKEILLSKMATIKD